MSKHLDESGMRNELRGSTFFAKDHSPLPSTTTERPIQEEGDQAVKSVGMPETSNETTASRHRETMTPRDQKSAEQMIETIRHAVRQLGKEDATYRFTGDEKKALADIVYTHASAGIRTSQNEVTRIAINWLIEDYRANGQASVLEKVMARLKS